MNRRRRRQIFLSHTWCQDETGRDTHARVISLSNALCRFGWSVWIDAHEMRQNLDGCMAQGIREADAIIICLTKQYANKVNRAAESRNSNDNCLKEWNGCFTLEKLVVPLVMETCMLVPSRWPWGVVPMRLAMHLYVDGTDDDTHVIARRIHEYLIRQNLRPVKRHNIRQIISL